MKSKTRVPRDIAPFNTYINNTDAYLQKIDPITTDANWKRLGLTNQNATDWNGKRKYWQDTLYPLYGNSDTRTTAITKEVNKFKTEFTVFARPLLNIMVASPNANIHDEEVFNFVINPKKPTHQHTPITEQCYGTYQALGGGNLKVGYRTATDVKRPSLAKGANCVQVAVKIGGTPPNNVLDGTILQIIPRASYAHGTGIDSSGKKLYVYQRWYNSKNPDLAGPWSELQSLLIV